ncbi:ARID DNA-binding domain-containing protein [Artemisia annua]|uniref:ARID DNA-binding domain-containing protein n=1 Tax=Artemisia annua TaxID=35608 RepID=A0A2U1MVR9_ARTAN|nr:ARID DNA-binding domain-containing protein [Artemisia annua]
MVNSNYYIENKLSHPKTRSVDNSNNWHQSKILGRNTLNRSHTEFVQRQIKRNNESVFGNQIKQISKACKDMLKKKMEEIQVHNNNLTQKKATVERHKNYVCFNCRLRGHIARDCPKEGNLTEDVGLGIITDKSKVHLTYPEFIHLSTDFMVEGTDEQGWNQIWYVSNRINRHVCSNMYLFSKLKEKFAVEKIEEQKKFMFIHGIGEVQIKFGTEVFIIPGVHYTPEISLNILSVSQLEAQGLELTFKGNRCKPIPMFRNSADCIFDADRMNQKHNEYLDGYFRMMNEAMDDHREEQHREEAVTYTYTCSICEENGHLDYMCPQNSFTAEEDDYVIIKGVHLPFKIKSFSDCILLLKLLEGNRLNSHTLKLFRKNFIEAYMWFYSVYLKRNTPVPFPPKINGKEIHLMDLHILIEALGGYLGVDFSNKFSYVAETLGLDRNFGQDVKQCYNHYLNVFICFYKTANVSQDEAENIASKGKEICQGDQDDQVTKTSTLDIQNLRRVEHFGVKLEDTTDYGQKNHVSTQFEQGSTSKNNERAIENKENKDDFSVIV